MNGTAGAVEEWGWVTGAPNRLWTVWQAPTRGLAAGPLEWPSHRHHPGQQRSGVVGQRQAPQHGQRCQPPTPPANAQPELSAHPTGTPGRLGRPWRPVHTVDHPSLAPGAAERRAPRSENAPGRTSTKKLIVLPLRSGHVKPESATERPVREKKSGGEHATGAFSDGQFAAHRERRPSRPTSE